jgi:transposase
MRTGRPLTPLVLTDEELETLNQWAQRPTTPQAKALRARIILSCAAGKANKEIAATYAVSPEMVSRWRNRFLRARLKGLLDARKPRAKTKLTQDVVDRVVARTLQTKPHNATHWSTRSMAKAMGLSQTAISKIWRQLKIQPHREKTFKLSKDPKFAEKVRDVVGLYMNPPERALVLSVDEKSQIQALDRTQPLLPMRLGKVERRTHDYVRHGTLSLFAALDIKTGYVISKCHERHRAKEFLSFLKTIDARVPTDLEIHVILDNYSTHKTAEVRKWLAKHKRFHLHFTPTSASWLNLVERFFADLTEKQLRRGTHCSTRELEAAIRAYIEANNTAPTPFIWTKTADEIISRVAKVYDDLANSGH